jgi:hypothetical protein
MLRQSLLSLYVMMDHSLNIISIIVGVCIILVTEESYASCPVRAHTTYILVCMSDVDDKEATRLYHHYYRHGIQASATMTAYYAKHSHTRGDDDDGDGVPHLHTTYNNDNDAPSLSHEKNEAKKCRGVNGYALAGHVLAARPEHRHMAMLSPFDIPFSSSPSITTTTSSPPVYTAADYRNMSINGCAIPFPSVDPIPAAERVSLSARDSPSWHRFSLLPCSFYLHNACACPTLRAHNRFKLALSAYN